MFQNQMACNGVPVPSPFFPANFMWQMDETQQPAHEFRGVATVLGKRSMSFPGIGGCDAAEDELSDDGSQPGEKKRRLNLEQVRTLERSFEMGNRLEPERKMQLARALGLQPRQIAIWFQNRRARWKTKQLEKDYDALKMQYEATKSENDALQAQNKKLQAEISALKGHEAPEPINLNKETEASCSNRSENSSEINLDVATTPAAASAKRAANSSQGRPFLPSFRHGSRSQLAPASGKSDAVSPKIENTVQDESFSNMFCNIDDQPAFWPWSENHNFH